MKRVCAWCGLVLGTTPDSDKGVTHGICASCRAAMEEEIAKMPKPAKPRDECKEGDRNG